jgi:hypothetical protein
MINKESVNKFLVRFLLIDIFLVISGCDFVNPLISQLPSKTNGQDTTQINSRNVSPNKKVSFDQSYQGNLSNLNGLLLQLQKNNPDLERQSKERYEFALKSQELKDWGSASKGFAESVSLKPTPNALLGYALSQIMTNVNTPNSQESLDTKLRNFRDAIKLYQVAIELAKETKQPLSKEQQQTVNANSACLKAFLSSPNPKSPTCQLVADALQVSKIR